jgi:hypothetical protein
MGAVSERRDLVISLSAELTMCCKILRTNHRVSALLSGKRETRLREQVPSIRYLHPLARSA